ncbi:MAG: single-stranded DNA-binding protein [Burkholderiales bacterium]
MIKITVAQTTVKELSGTSKTTGKPYHMRFQNAYAFTVDREGNTPPYPEKFEISLDKDAAPYAPGDYTLHPSALYLDRDGRLACSPRLTPIKARVPA